MKHQSFSFFSFYILFALVNIAFADLAYASRYELIKGKGVEVCEAYQNNLNSINHPYPMMCEREINPEMKDFKKPDWAQPDLEQARALRFDMTKLVSRVLNRPEPKSEADMKVRIEEEESIKRWVAHVDIDNDGTSDTVLKQQDGDCPMHRAFSVSIAVLTEDGKHYDLEKSQYIDVKFSRLVGQLNKDPKTEERRPPGLAKTNFWGYALYDIFLYRGGSYFDIWETGKDYPSPRSGRLHVLLRKDGTTREICTYRFK